MPTYEYKCDKCDKIFEVFQGIKDEPIKNCPKCKSKVKKLISTGAGLIFKGKGFYQTDYKSAAPPDGEKGKPSLPCGKSEKCGSCDLED
ncbi:MAG: zinc ribbon domain-containing protein [Candidatus Omnitrophica bacterium]|nr:zinc ribbon domain-containing protein [Candidatus Omnitrophota bacterium]